MGSGPGMVGGSAEEVTRPWALRDGRSWRGRVLRPQCTTHRQDAEASWAGRAGQSEAPRPETYGFIPRVGPEGSSPCSCHMKRCISIVRGHAGASGGRWDVHPRAEREKVATHTENALKVCTSVIEVVVLYHVYQYLAAQWASLMLFEFSLALTKSLKTVLAA